MRVQDIMTPDPSASGVRPCPVVSLRRPCLRLILRRSPASGFRSDLRSSLDSCHRQPVNGYPASSGWYSSIGAVSGFRAKLGQLLPDQPPCRS